MLSRLVITFLPRSKRLLISWLQSPSAVILEPRKIKSKVRETQVQGKRNHNHRQLANLITWTTALSNSMKLSHAVWGHPRQAGHGGDVDTMWSTGEGNGKPLQYSCLENPINSMKRQKNRTLKDELPRVVGAQYAAGGQWRNNSRRNEETEPK